MFSGYPKDALNFLRDIARNKNRAWYERHKPRFKKSLLGPSRELNAELNKSCALRDLGLSASERSPLFA